MDVEDQLAGRFEASRPRLRAMAYRMLGSLSDADDAVQEGWLHVARAAARGGADDVANLEGWFTTIVGRVCLDMLRSRKSRREDPLDPDDAAVAGPEQIVITGGVAHGLSMAVRLLGRTLALEDPTSTRQIPLLEASGMPLVR